MNNLLDPQVEWIYLFSLPCNEASYGKKAHSRGLVNRVTTVENAPVPCTNTHALDHHLGMHPGLSPSLSWVLEVLFFFRKKNRSLHLVASAEDN